MAYLNLTKMKVFMLGAVALSIAVSGCKAPDIHDSGLDSTAAKAAKPVVMVPITAIAGLTVKSGTATPPAMVVTARPDPFALMPDEVAYEKQQFAAYLATTNAGFGLIYQGAPPEEPPPSVEPQPYRRLAGILIGDSVTALIDMGNGQLVEIHPGMIIPGTDWMVVSIDSEKAVLRRVNSNRLPNEVIVRLEVAPPGAQNQQSAPSFGPNNGFGGPPQGNGPPGQAMPGSGGERDNGD